MTSRGKTDSADSTLPPNTTARTPAGSLVLWVGVVVFGVSMVAGIVRSFSERRSLPPVGVEYTTELDAMIRARGQQAALPEVRSAAKIDFDNEIAVRKLLRTARELGDTEEVVWSLVALARLKPEDGEVRNGLTAALLEQGRYGEAYAQGRFALWLTPQSPQTYCNLGEALLQLDRPQEAAAVYRRALELDPSSATARQGLQASLGDA